MTNTLHHNPNTAPDFTDYGALNPNTDPTNNPATPENQPMSAAGEAITRVANWFQEHRSSKPNESNNGATTPEAKSAEGEHDESSIAYRGLLQFERAKEATNYHSRQAKRFVQRIGAGAKERIANWKQNAVDSGKNLKKTFAKWEPGKDSSLSTERTRLERKHGPQNLSEYYAKLPERPNTITGLVWAHLKGEDVLPSLGKAIRSGKYLDTDKLKSLPEGDPKKGVRRLREERRTTAKEHAEARKAADAEVATPERYQYLSAQARLKAKLSGAKADRIEGLFNRSEATEAKLQAERRKQEREEIRARMYGKYEAFQATHEKIMSGNRHEKLNGPAHSEITREKWNKRLDKLPVNMRYLGEDGHQEEAIELGIATMIEQFMKANGYPEARIKALGDNAGDRVIGMLRKQFEDKLPTESDKRRFVYQYLGWEADQIRQQKGKPEKYGLSTLSGAEPAMLADVQNAVFRFGGRPPKRQAPTNGNGNGTRPNGSRTRGGGPEDKNGFDKADFIDRLRSTRLLDPNGNAFDVVSVSDNASKVTLMGPNARQVIVNTDRLKTALDGNSSDWKWEV